MQCYALLATDFHLIFIPKDPDKPKEEAKDKPKAAPYRVQKKSGAGAGDMPEVKDGEAGAEGFKLKKKSSGPRRQLPPKVRVLLPSG